MRALGRSRSHHFRLPSRLSKLAWIVGVGSCILWAMMSLFRDLDGRAVGTLDQDLESLRQAVSLLPDDPEIHRRLGRLYLLDPLALDPSRALMHFQRAVEASPFDHTLWIDVGRAYEQRDRSEEAERAYRRAVTLAPRYFRPRWIYANFLLRHGRLAEGVTELEHLIEADPDAMRHIFDLVWQATGEEGRVLVAWGRRSTSDRVRAELIRFLADRQGYEGALIVWRAMGRQTRFKLESGLHLVSVLMSAHQWDRAARVWQEVLLDHDERLSIDDLRFWNRNFERERWGEGFDWRIESSQGVDVRIDDTTSWDGERSLRLRFRQHNGLHFEGVYHDVLIEPARDTILRFRYKTKGMLARNGVVVEITDAVHPGRWRARTPPLGNPTEWTEETLSFRPPPETHILRLRIVRRPMDILHDYVAGEIWFDAFSLEPASAIAR